MALRMSSGSSWTVTPPVSLVASSSPDIAESHAVSGAEDRRHLFVAHAAREQPVARVGVVERLREQLVQQQHLDVPVAHQVDERVELLARPAHPDHVVEEEPWQFVGDSRSCARSGRCTITVRSFPDLRVGTESLGCRSARHALSSGSKTARRTGPPWPLRLPGLLVASLVPPGEAFIAQTG